MRFDYQHQLSDEERRRLEESLEVLDPEYLRVNREFMKWTRSEWNVNEAWPFRR